MSRKQPNKPWVRLSEDQYRQWLDEAPKTIEGAFALAYDSQGNPFVRAVPFASKVLPEHYQGELILYGTSDKYSGLKIYAMPARFQPLLRGDQRHGGAPFFVGNVQYSGEQPHFHELDYAGGRKRPGDRRIVPEALDERMAPDAFSQAMLQHYWFEPEGFEASIPPADSAKQATFDGEYRWA